MFFELFSLLLSLSCLSPMPIQTFKCEVTSLSFDPLRNMINLKSDMSHLHTSTHKSLVFWIVERNWDCSYNLERNGLLSFLWADIGHVVELEWRVLKLGLDMWGLWWRFVWSIRGSKECNGAEYSRIGLCWALMLQNWDLDPNRNARKVVMNWSVELSVWRFVELLD